MRTVSIDQNSHAEELPLDLSDLRLNFKDLPSTP
jgi:hypothetical protein